MHISSTNCLNEILGSQPSFFFALEASPNKVSTSAGLKYLGSTRMITFLVFKSYPHSFNPLYYYSKKEELHKLLFGVFRLATYSLTGNKKPGGSNLHPHQSSLIMPIRQGH